MASRSSSGASDCPTRSDPRRLSVRFRSRRRDDERTITVSAVTPSQGRYVEVAKRVVGAMMLVLDTATRTPVVALANDDGTLIGERRWASHHRHGEELLQRLDESARRNGQVTQLHELVIVGTGPGSFTGLRIGLATAKTIAYALEHAGRSASHPRSPWCRCRCCQRRRRCSRHAARGRIRPIRTRHQGHGRSACREEVAAARRGQQDRQ